ncbi:hypothetical protein NT05LI_0607 [Listeria ivanovii FSL F6-596]|nr:hypothetical protein NT05LI_0607 [Listeria ivanovii FSL F6-596]
MFTYTDICILIFKTQKSPYFLSKLEIKALNCLNKYAASVLNFYLYLTKVFGKKDK